MFIPVLDPASQGEQGTQDEDGASSEGKVAENRLLLHLMDVGKEEDVGNGSRAVSNPDPFPSHFTAWYERRIFDKTRQNSQGKKTSYSLLLLYNHTHNR